MATPDEVRDAVNAIRNQIPETMIASRLVLDTLIEVRGLRGVAELDTQDAINKLAQTIRVLSGSLIYSVITLEDRIERFAGQPGFPNDRLAAILTEFKSDK